MLLELRRFLNSNPGIFAHFPVEVRFVAADDIYLSPSFGRDSCYINIIMYRPFGRSTDHHKYWDEYERIMKNAGGRPHWAKVCFNYFLIILNLLFLSYRLIEKQQ